MSNARLPLALSILLVAACGDAGTSPTTDADAGTDATTAGCASEGGDSSTTDADADASTSAGSSSTSDASSGEGSGGGDGSSSTGEPAPVPTEGSGGGDGSGSTGEPAPVPTSCFGTPCSAATLCLPGLTCLTHPGTGEGMCVTTCLAAPICDVEAVSCGAFIPKVAPVECIDGGCFPAVCDVLADCPAGSVACDATGLCY